MMWNVSNEKFLRILSACSIFVGSLISLSIGGAHAVQTTDFPAIQSLCGRLEDSKPIPIEDSGLYEENCSSAEECLQLAREYLAKPFGALRARGVLEKAIALDPRNAFAFKSLASAYMRSYEMLNTARLSREEACRAEAVCRKAIALEPNDADAWLMLGEIINASKFWEYREDAGVQALRKAIELRPDWPEAYCSLGHAYDLLKRYEEAASAYSIEADLRERSAVMTVHATREMREHTARDAFVTSQILTKLARYDEALHVLLRGQAADSQNDLIRYWTGRTYLNLGDVDSARREQKRLVELCKMKDDMLAYSCHEFASRLLNDIEKVLK